MARSKSKKQQEPEIRLINAALALAARRRWRDIRMADIAAEAEMSIADALAQVHSKTAILNALGRHINRAVLEDLHTGSEIGDSPKDRLFELMMRRFDAMRDFRSGLASISSDLGLDPCAALRHRPTLDGCSESQSEARSAAATPRAAPRKRPPPL